MSLYGMMRTSVSGMQAQAARLTGVADNIANADTTGFKRYSTEFTQLVRPGQRAINASAGESGGVITNLRQSVSQSGTLRFTESKTDLAINGTGFFVVQDEGGQTYLSRAGSFVPDDEGFLVNAAGMRLAGYSTDQGAPAPVANGFGNLEPVSISRIDLTAAATTSGVFSANLPADADIITGDTAASNSAVSQFEQKVSLSAYDNIGSLKLVDIYFSKNATNQWEVAVFDQADANPGTSFPYANGPLVTQTLSFDPNSGEPTAGSPSTIDIPIPNGQTASIALAGMRQLGTGYTVLEARTNGNAPEPISAVDFDSDGTLFAQYGDGTARPLYRIPLANVVSPDNLEARTGSVFLPSAESGDVQIGFPGDGTMGTIVTSALEQSNVDIAEELTAMIQSQRGYTANSKVFQTGSDLMDVLINLKR